VVASPEVETADKSSAHNFCVARHPTTTICWAVSSSKAAGLDHALAPARDPNDAPDRQRLAKLTALEGESHASVMPAMATDTAPSGRFMSLGMTNPRRFVAAELAGQFNNFL